MNKEWKMKVFVVAVFVFGIAFHYFYGTFDKSVELLPDELRYYCMAKSIYLGDGFTFKGLDLSYNKFGYMLFLVPFFAVKSGILRIKMITLFSSVAMMASIFPLNGIMNRLKLKSMTKAIILISFIVFPGLMMSATYMAEIVYWPLFFLFVYLWMVGRERKGIIYYILLGIISYYGYATKEVFLGLMVSIVLFEVLYPIVSHLSVEKEKRTSLKEKYHKKNIINAAIVLAVFIIIHVICKLTIFSGMHNSYDNQIGLSVLLSVDNILYMAYGFLYYVAAILIGVFIMPVIAPVLLNRSLDDKTRALHFFNILNVIVFIGIVVFTITVREDLGDIIPRLHFRYFDPLLVIFVVTFFVCMDRKDISLKLYKSTIITIGITLIGALVVFRGVDTEVYIDQFTLNWVGYLKDKLSDVPAEIVTDIIVTASVLIITVLLIKSKRLAARIVSFIIILLTCISNTVLAKGRIYSAMYRQRDVIEAAVDINDKLKNEEGGILYISAYSDKEKCIDTFFDKNDNLYYVDWNYSKGYKSGTYDIKDMSLPLQFGLWQLEYENINSIDYILVEKEYEPVGVKLINITLDEELSNNHYLVYKNNDNTKLSYENIE